MGKYLSINKAEVTLWEYDTPSIYANLHRQSYTTLMRLGRGRVLKGTQTLKYTYNGTNVFLRTDED